MLGSGEKDAGNCDRAIAHLNRALCLEKHLELEGFAVMPHLLLGECYASKGLHALAIEEYETARALLEPSTWAGQQDIPKIDRHLEALRKQLHEAK
jgi:tetratricopeptide (TPR) repeat protein